tara:strand:+ start:296 stop:412 length:117 start_codon:yes stop_codon:yes gene_type:complete
VHIMINPIANDTTVIASLKIAAIAFILQALVATTPDIV